MKISSIYIQNFRRLLQCRVDFSQETTLFVGANNSGKTSAMDALGKFLAEKSFSFNDITISNRDSINNIGAEWIKPAQQEPQDYVVWEPIVPQMDIWLDVSSCKIQYVTQIIPTLKWRGGKLGVRLAYLPKDLPKLFKDFKEAYNAARDTESKNDKDDIEFKLFPKDLCEYLETKLTSYFSIKAFILDPVKAENDPPQPTAFAMECFENNPLKGIVKVDMIDAQRGLSDPDSTDRGEKARKRLSMQIRSYYDKHLDPELIPTPEDLDMLMTTDKARQVFDRNLSIKFAPAIQELEGLGYPGVTDPKITLMSKVNPADTLRHDSVVQYALSKNNPALMLPEKFNGLGYQNLISIVFDLMSFRDDWMKVGKAKQSLDSFLEPLHLVFVEEPETHLHMQVQQVFIRKAYEVLRNHKSLGKSSQYSTQLVISTHSSHIARETDFAALRYFKRLPEDTECCVATSKVINLTDIFGAGEETDKFVTRYLQTTHCDLFFADAAILVEGPTESILLPHFIRNHYPELYYRYITILPINGRHSHRLAPLIKALCIPTLVVTDLDSVEKGGHHKAARPERGKGLISGNFAITKWLIGESDLDKLLDLDTDKKVILQDNLYASPIRIAYQTPVPIRFEGNSKEALSCTFEDNLVYTNFDLFKNLSTGNANNMVKKIYEAIISENSFESLHKRIYEILSNDKSGQKAALALDIIYDIDPKDIKVPSYIGEGLDWLQDLLHPEEVGDGEVANVG